MAGTIPEDKGHELHPVIEILQRLDIVPTRREEMLSVEDFPNLTLAHSPSTSLGGGGNVPYCARFSHLPTGIYFSPTLPADCFAIDFLGRAISPIECLQTPCTSLCGAAKVALYCAHRTSTVSSRAFCEQEGHLAAPFPSFRDRA